MQFIVFSDIHGRLDALAAMLAQVRNRAAGAIFCVDLVGGDSNAPQIVRLLRGLPHLLAVRGNNDQHWHRAFRDKPLAPPPALAEVDAYIVSLPHAINPIIGSRRVFVCHGSPDRPLTGRVYEDTALDGMPECDFLFLGHTHCRMDRVINGRRVINPGSLGMPRDGKGRSCCMVDFDSGEATFLQVEIPPHAGRTAVLPQP